MNPILSFVALAFALLVSGCASLPPLEGRNVTAALPIADTAQTQLGRAIAPRVAANPDKTGIHPLPDPRDAFAARVVLALAAEKSLDVQYYIWHGDQVGYLLFEALWNAAERGVRVRLLLDDINTGGLDPTIAALDAHPNIEIRLYNPVILRRARLLNFLTDFSRVNHRMHNKSFTADNQVSIVGGRNIGNEYFGAGTGVAFADLDVVAMGRAVREVSTEFDLYWNSPSAYPAASMLGAIEPDAAGLKARFAATRADPESVTYIDAVRAAPLVSTLLERPLDFEWVPARLVYDDPAKTLDTTARKDVLLFPELVRTIGRPEKSFDLISPYLVLGSQGTAAIAALTARGVKVRILTNSLAAAEASVVHSGYAKRRLDLLRAGVSLYEIKPTLTRKERKKVEREKEDDDDKAKFGSSSPSALHAKTFAVDRKRVFVGSFNFDPRSLLLNTEMGLAIDSPLLGERLASFFDTVVPQAAYEVRLVADSDNMEWIERTAAGETRYSTEPESGWLRRVAVQVLSILPVDWML